MMGSITYIYAFHFRANIRFCLNCERSFCLESDGRIRQALGIKV